MAAVLAEAGQTDGSVLDVAMVVVSELASNAVEHARTPFEVAVETAPGLRITVADGSPVLPARRDAGPLEVSGRGLMMLEAAGRWAAEPHGGGKRVSWEHDPLARAAQTELG
jgi:anti-sigma regulatory factor (Ser/Thr protein kinase)